MLKTGTILVALLSATAALADVRPMPEDGLFSTQETKRSRSLLRSL